jgi:hypothetical protein
MIPRVKTGRVTCDALDECWIVTAPMIAGLPAMTHYRVDGIDNAGAPFERCLYAEDEWNAREMVLSAPEVAQVTLVVESQDCLR